MKRSNALLCSLAVVGLLLSPALASARQWCPVTDTIEPSVERSIFQSTMLVKPNNGVFVAYVQGTPLFGHEPELIFERWHGQGWNAVGAPLNDDKLTRIHSVALALRAPSETPVVAWTQGSSIHVKQWDGSGWWPLGGGPITLDNSGEESRLSVALDGSLYVIYRDRIGGQQRIAAKRCGAIWCSSWQNLGMVADSERTLSVPDVATMQVGDVNVPVVAWSERESDGVRHVHASYYLESAGWAGLGQSSLNPVAWQDAGAPRIAAFGVDSLPVVTFKQWNFITGQDDQYVMQLAVSGQGVEWQQLGPSLSETETRETSIDTESSIDVDAAGMPVVSFVEYEIKRLGQIEITLPSYYVKRWRGSWWEQLDPDDMRVADLSVAKRSEPRTAHILARQGTDLQVYRYQRCSWPYPVQQQVR